MIVCICNRVSDKTITKLALTGQSFDEVQIALGVAQQCGKCKDCAMAIVQACRNSCPYRNGITTSTETEALIHIL